MAVRVVKKARKCAITCLFVTQSPTYIIGPALLLLLLAVGFSLISDALNEAVNRR